MKPNSKTSKVLDLIIYELLSMFKVFFYLFIYGTLNIIKCTILYESEITDHI